MRTSRLLGVLLAAAFGLAACGSSQVRSDPGSNVIYAAFRASPDFHSRKERAGCENLRGDWANMVQDAEDPSASRSDLEQTVSFVVMDLSEIRPYGGARLATAERLLNGSAGNRRAIVSYAGHEKGVQVLLTAAKVCFP